MIINHKYRFIFLKTRKTAGTSIEVALSGLCDSLDVITPISPEDEEIRQEMGFTGPRNYIIPFEFYNDIDYHRFMTQKRPKLFYNHAPAMFIRENIKEEIWNSYFKFCFERNPFDKAVSRYYWGIRNLKSKPEISSYLKSIPSHLLSDWKMYTMDGKVIVDFIGSYENLHRDFRLVLNKLCITIKSNYLVLKGTTEKITGIIQMSLVQKIDF
jgi:hypothetical protein